MLTWDDLTEEQKKRLSAEGFRTHMSVNRAIILDRLDARAKAFDEAIAWLAANGFGAASAALAGVAFEPLPGADQR